MPTTTVLGRAGALLVAEHQSEGQYGPYSFRYYLTPCHLADATGTEHGVACRACYLPLPDIWGATPGPLTEVFGDGVPLEIYKTTVPKGV